MAQAVTYAEILRRAKAKADMKFSDFIDSDGWLDLINTSIRKLYNKLVEADQDFYTVARTITTDGTCAIYRLPTDFYKLRGVDYTVNNVTLPMKKFNFRERNDSQNRSSIVRYRLIGNQLHFIPTPPAQIITLWIVPVFSGFNGSDLEEEFDGINGWEEYVVLDCAVQALVQEESDASQVMAERQILETQIEGMKTDRDHENAERVGDVTGNHAIDLTLGDLV